jgi:phage tail sheath gpL-like
MASGLVYEDMHLLHHFFISHIITLVIPIKGTFSTHCKIRTSSTATHTRPRSIPWQLADMAGRGRNYKQHVQYSKAHMYAA